MRRFVIDTYHEQFDDSMKAINVLANLWKMLIRGESLGSIRFQLLINSYSKLYSPTSMPVACLESTCATVV